MVPSDYLENGSPAWFAELKKIKADQKRHVFLLHFNIRDLVFDPKHPPATPSQLRTVLDFLSWQLSGRDVALYYSMHSGIELFAPPESLERSYRAQTPQALWESVARDAATSPYSLSPGIGDRSEEQAPEYWRRPDAVVPLLTRTLTYPYFREASALVPPSDGTRADAQPLSFGLIVDYVEHLAPPPDVPTRHEVSPIVEALQRWSTSPLFVERNHLVILLASEWTRVHPELRGTDSRMASIRVERPTRDERFEFLSWLSRFSSKLNADDDFSVLQQPGLVEQLANRTSGMNFLELREFVRSMQRYPDRDFWGELEQQRAEIIQRESGGLLVPKESKFGLDDVAGYQYIRKYVERRLVERLRQGRADVTGVLFAGPPGTGKSFFAGALARSAGVNVVTMRNIRGMWVGQSERNFEQVLQVAQSLAPVIIFIDEIDQAFANRQQATGDGGVEQRLLGRLLEFMDDKANLGKVIWVAATNRPDLLDDALLSRFKLVLPFLLPDQATCKEMLQVQLPRQAGYAWQEGSWGAEQDAIARSVSGRYSGRELETIVRAANWLAEDAMLAWEAQSPATRDAVPPIQEAPTPAGRPLVHARFLTDAVRDTTVAHNEREYLRQSLLALQKTPFSSADLILATQSALPQNVRQRVIVDSRIDKEAIDSLLTAMGQGR